METDYMNIWKTVKWANCSFVFEARNDLLEVVLVSLELIQDTGKQALPIQEIYGSYKIKIKYRNEPKTHRY